MFGKLFKRPPDPKEQVRDAIDRLWVMDPRDAYFEVIDMDWAISRARERAGYEYRQELTRKFGAANADLILAP